MEGLILLGLLAWVMWNFASSGPDTSRIADERERQMDLEAERREKAKKRRKVWDF